MRRPLIIAVLVLAASVAAPAAAKPKNCFSDAEIGAEREVRHGIYLREAARRCDEDYLKGSAAAWQKFETANGTRFRAANAKRVKAWKREFPDDWQTKMTHADGRLVTFARHLPRTGAFCDNIDGQLKEIGKRGYGAFATQSKRVHNEVIGDYKVCQ